MTLKEIDEQAEQSLEGVLSLDVKLAFNRVCSLIYSLEDDIGQEAASYQLLRIRNDVDKVLKRKRNKLLYKENGFHHFSELDTTNTTVRSKRTHNFTSQYNISERPGCLQPYNGNVSCFSVLSETGNGPSFTNAVEEKKELSAKYHQQNGNISFFSAKNDDLCTSFSSSFRPMAKNNLDAEKSVQLGTIVEESRFEIDESEEDSASKEDNEEKNFFILKYWSILLKDGNLLLTGIKMNEKGEILEKNFVSKKVLARKEKNTVKTLDGEFVLEGTVTDKNRNIPLEVKKQFFENDEFPRHWRKAVNLWIELEDKKTKEEKAKKKALSQKKMKDVSNRKNSISPKKKMKEEKTRKRSISPKKTMKDVSDRKRSISPKKKMKDEKPSKRSISPKKKMQNSQSKKEVKESAKKLKSPVPSTKKPDTSAKGKNKKTNDNSKNNSKKNKFASDLKNPDNNDLEKNGNNKNGEGEDEHGPFSELLGDSLMILPTTSLTPNGLLSSIKKNVIKGRYTPPTSMFDNVYGTKSDNNSSLNTSFDDVGVVKNNHVVKRMCKVKNKPKLRQNNKSPKVLMEEDEAINEILRVAKTKTNTTPSIIKHVFSAERAEDSVNFSDLSDIEDV